ncbi:MAG: porin [Acidobacteriota bacterium]
MTHRFPIAPATLALALVAATPAAAQTPPREPTGAADELDQRPRGVERRLELADEAAAEKAKTAAAVVAGADGFALRSADGAFQLRLRGLLQTDGRWFFGDDERPLADTLVVRRARPILEGTLWKIVDFRLMPDFGSGGSTLQDGYLDLRFSPAVRLRAGKAKVPVGLEALLEDANLPFVERGLPSALAPVRDVGVQIHGEPAGGRLSYAAGLFNGSVDGGSGDGDNADDKDVAARILVRPFQRPASEPSAPVGLAFGIGASLGDQIGSTSAPTLPAFRTAGNQTFFSYLTDGTAAGTTLADGERLRLAPQLYLHSGPWYLLAEWTESRQEIRRDATRAELTHRAWQLVGSWAVTGEPVTERGFAPRRPWERGGGRGGLLISVRYGELELDTDTFPTFADPSRTASSAANLGVSLGWALHRSVKLVLDGEQTTFEGGAAGGDRETERVLLARAQLTF